MSASPDPTPTSRRRHVAIGHTDLAHGDAIATRLHPSRGNDSMNAGPDTVLASSIDAPPRRTTAKKPAAAKPLWKTILSVFTKNLVVLLVLLVLAQMLRRLAFNRWETCDYEKRIADMEAFLKSTTKMMQVRVDAVDQKIRHQIHGLKTQLGKRIDANADDFSRRLLDLDGRVESMEKSLNWVSKDEFDRLMEEFKGFDNLGDLKLDEVRGLAKEMIEKEIEKHAADGVGRVDYALASGGAMVLQHSEPFSRGWLDGNSVSGDAVKMLQPSFGEPGQCFALSGNNGFVEIKLRTAIVPQAITLEHVAKSVAFDRSSAPKECQVYGWLHKAKVQRHLVAEFVYDLEKSNAQTYNVMDMGVIDTIRVEFMSNHGNPRHTCIYRLRVHGQDVISMS